MKTKIIGLISVVAAATALASRSHADVRCEWLFYSVTGERLLNAPNPGVVPSDAGGANTKAWLRDSFFDILERFPFVSRYHSSRFLALDRSLMEAGFRRGETDVRELRQGAFEVRVLYTSPHPTIADQSMTVESKINFFTGGLMESRDGGTALWEQNFVHRVVGITNSKTDVARRVRGRRETQARFSQPWTDHMRDVLENILVPLAIGSRSVTEVGIGFGTEASLDAKAPSNQTPKLIINRIAGYYEPLNVSSQLLASNKGQTDFDGVYAVETFVDKGTATSVYIVNRLKYLVVFDELLGRNEKGSVYAIDRATGERRALHYRPDMRVWSFDQREAGETSSAAGARIYDPSKVNPRLGERIDALRNRGDNPRINVVIQRIGLAGGTQSALISVREAGRISLEADVESIVETISAGVKAGI